MEKLRGLEISTAMGCRLRCDYCPQKLLISKYYNNTKSRNQYLSMDGLKKALESVEEGGFVSFCGMVEPFHNPECAEMIKYAYEQGYRVYLFTTLMGMTLNDFEKIKHIKFDFFELHIPDEQERCHFEITKEYKEVLKVMQETFDTYTYCCHGDVHHEIKDIIFEDKIARLQLSDRAGNLDIGRPKLNRKAPFICAHGFEDSLNMWLPVMLPDGTLVACCNDYGLKHQMGNLIERPWTEICQDAPYREFRKSWECDDVRSLCNTCGSAIPIKNLPAKRLQRWLEDDNRETDYLFPEFAHRYEMLLETRRFIIWGTGNYFLDHYEYFKWNEALKPTAILDSNEINQGKVFAGVICTNPNSFQFEEKDLVVVFVKQGNGIKRYLEEKKINYIMADELFSLARKL